MGRRGMCEETLNSHFALIQDHLREKFKSKFAKVRKLREAKKITLNLEQQMAEEKRETWECQNNIEMQFDDEESYPIARKCSILISNQDALIKADKNRINNRRGE